MGFWHVTGVVVVDLLDRLRWVIRPHRYATDEQ
jgi:hypothetical protein